MNNTHRILFEKPDHEALARHYTVVDMHVHTTYSDGRCSPDEVLERARELGIGVAVTDHNEIEGALQVCRQKRVLSIPGIEVTSRLGTHILIYFYDLKSLERFYARDIRPFMGNGVMSATDLTLEEIIPRARAYQSVVVFPHPYCAAYTGVQNTFFTPQRQERLLSMADGVEVINAGNLKRWNLKSAVLGFNLDKSITGGSDGHALNHIGRAVTYADCPKSRRAFLDAVVNRGCKVIGKEVDLFRKVADNGRKLGPNIRNTPNVVERNIKYGYQVLNNKSKNLKENVKRTLNGKFKKSA
jgi:predicted metal-dependent phosphoesterase TrpH